MGVLFKAIGSSGWLKSEEERTQQKRAGEETYVRGEKGGGHGGQFRTAEPVPPRISSPREATSVIPAAADTSCPFWGTRRLSPITTEKSLIKRWSARSARAGSQMKVHAKKELSFLPATKVTLS